MATASTVVRQNLILRKALLAEDLVKRMDEIACLSAEKHAKHSAVTLNMDELLLENVTPKPGAIIRFMAQVNRAWNTSMEVGCRVEVEGGPLLCSCYFVFVALKADGSKAKVPPIVPDSAINEVRFGLAGERRKIRFSRKKLLTKSAASSAANWAQESTTTASTSAGHPGTSVAAREVEATQLVLPPCANHHGNTFGGIVMAWACEAATVTARLHANLQSVRLVAIDDVHFVAPSTVGDRVILRSTVNRCFGQKSLEVGVRVDACGLDGVERRIVEVFATFECEGDEAVPQVTLTPSDSEAESRFHRAAGRRRIRLERLAIKASHVAWQWSDEPSLRDTLLVENLKSLLKVSTLEAHHEEHLNGIEGAEAGTEGWVWVTGRQVPGKATLVKSEARFPVTAAQAFEAVLDTKSRLEWDGDVVSAYEICKPIDDTNDITRLEVRVPDRDQALTKMDFALLRSWREDVETGTYVLAARSVVTAAVPPIPGVRRAEVASSGFIIQADPEEPNECIVTYVAQLAGSAVAVAIPSLQGESQLAVMRFIRLFRLLTTGSPQSPRLASPRKRKGGRRDTRCSVQ